MDSSNKRDEIHIGNVGGDAVGVGVSGSGNIIGKTIDISGTVIISNQQLKNVSSEYAGGLKAFSESINQQLKANNVPPDKVKPIQESINELIKESEGIKPERQVGVIKQSDLKSRFINVARHVLKVLPKTTETVAAFTPLAPFSKVIGEATQYLVEAIQKEV